MIAGAAPASWRTDRCGRGVTPTFLGERVLLGVCLRMRSGWRRDGSNDFRILMGEVKSVIDGKGPP